jgi:hypothetical protein
MRLSRSGKVWLTVAAAWPLWYLACVISILRLGDVKIVVGGAPPDPLPKWFQGLVAVHAATILVGVSVLIFCLLYLFRHSSLKGPRRVLWVVLLAFGGILTAPWFVWRHVASTDAMTGGPART